MGKKLREDAGQLGGIEPLERRIPYADTDRWLQQLRDEGYVVVSDVLAAEEVQEGQEKVWQWLESLGSGIDRADMDTWDDKRWPGAANLGFFQTHGGGQCDAAWFLRSRPNVKGAFASIWKTQELLTSFDTFICWRPWTSHSSWTPRVERLHCDQNPIKKKGFQCVQGMLPLLPVRPEGGGLQVVPGTHTDNFQAKLARRIPFVTLGGDWCELTRKDELIGTGRLLLADPGDMILWDSRLVHGGHVGTGVAEDKGSPSLARLALTVCMTPREKASEEVLELRRRAVREGLTLTHWPHEFSVHGMGDSGGSAIQASYTPPELTPEMQDLV